jgi:hypothetical protein
MKVRWEVWNAAKTSLCHVNRQFPLPHFCLSDLWRDLHELSPKEQFLSTQRHCHLVLDTLVLTRSSSSSSATSSTFFILPWERVSPPFLGCHYASFLVRSLGLLELFSNSLPERSKEWSDLCGLKPDGPPWASLVLSFFGHLSQGPASRAECPEDHLIWVDSIWTVYLGFVTFPLESLSYGSCL